MAGMIFKNKSKFVFGIIQFCIWIFLMFFFIKISPLIIFDFDDWDLMGTIRVPFPIWKGWNPTRVMPQMLLNLCGFLAGRVFYPLLGSRNYIYAITVSAAFIMSSFIMIMLLAAFYFFRDRLKCEKKKALCCELLFLIFHFAIFRNRGNSNCLFHAADLCCIFFYTLSGIVNITCVLIFLQSKRSMLERFCNWRIYRKVEFLLLVYGALFSNLFHSGIIVTFCVARVIVDLLDYLKESRKKELLRIFCKRELIEICVIFAYGIVLLFEVNGGRAAIVSDGGGFDIGTSLLQLRIMICAIAKPFMLISVVSFIGILFNRIVLYSKFDKEEKDIFDVYRMLIISLGFLTVFLLLLCAKIPYFARIEASYGVWSELSILIVIAMIVTLKNSKVGMIVIAAICTLCSIYPDGRYMISTMDETSYETCYEMDTYFVNTIYDAFTNGKEEVVMEIPDYTGTSLEWAFGDNLGNAISKNMLKFGIINKPVNVKIKKNKELNEYFKVTTK